jgi:TPR repeat protein
LQEPPSPESAANSSETASSTAGATELAQAEEFLNGRKYPRDSAIAAKYLWKAVGKENTSAILLLSDMYMAGDGVPKSCDQARLLLTAAARKGVPQAADKLRNLLRSGCR